VVSDDRFRGFSLSDGKPSAQLAIDYDGRGGWYMGALAASVRPEGVPRVQWLAFLGIARPLRAGLDWDAGVQYTTIGGDADYRYAEYYVGLAADHYSLRLYYARHFLGADTPTLYASLDRSWPLSGRWRLLGHVGLLRRNGAIDHGSGRYRADGRLGVGLDWRHFELQLAWTVARGSDGPYPFGYDTRRATRQVWVVSCSHSW
jgi:uncharacterized protein (TIGR02001 family)